MRAAKFKSVKTGIIAVLAALVIAASGAASAHDTRSVRYKGTRFEIAYKYRLSGRDLVVFIHGLACSKESFYDAWKEPWLNKYSLLAVDLPGFGESSRPPDFSYTLEDHAGVCDEMLRRSPHRRVHLVGHSMGGAVAALLAGRDPKRFVSLMSVDGCIGSQGGNSQGNISPPTYDEFTQRLIARIISSQGMPEEKGLRLWFEWSRSADPEGFRKSDESLMQWSRNGNLAGVFLNLSCKRAYFYPDRDGLPYILRRVKTVRTIEIPNSGHFIMNDNPEYFYAKLAEELAR